MDPKGVEAVHNVLTAAMDHALKMELIGRNPVTLVTPPKSPKKRAFVPEVSQVHALRPRRNDPNIPYGQLYM